MARKIKIALKMANGEMVRSIDELRAHFDMEKTLAYFWSGSLLKWAEERCSGEIADGIRGLSEEDDALAEKLCGILGVEYQESYKEIGKPQEEESEPEEAETEVSCALDDGRAARNPREILSRWKEGTETVPFLDNGEIRDCKLQRKEEWFRKKLA